MTPLFLRRTGRRLRRLMTHTSLAFFVFRYRYLASFILFGAVALVVEVLLVEHAMPRTWPINVKAGLAFAVGLATSFTLNATLNFRVPRQYLLQTFLRYALVSAASFLLNMALLTSLRQWSDWNYGPLRFVCAAGLCLAAYALHRRLTFRSSKNFGVAVYASSQERVNRIFRKVGRACDHIHVDLVDVTMNPTAAPVDLRQITRARKLWPGIPFAVHLMTRTPQRWLNSIRDEIDWFLFHLDSRDELFDLIAWCRRHDKKAGIVWHQDDSFAKLLPYLPHVDFVMVLGIAVPGQSGQSISEYAVETAAALAKLKAKYDFEVMFDGSVNFETISRIEASYVVAASAVLNSPAPVQAIYRLKTGAEHGRRQVA